jgi:hypothetical protein
MRKVAELSIEVKQQWLEEEMYTWPVTVSATGGISHTLHDVFKQLGFPDMLYVTL